MAKKLMGCPGWLELSDDRTSFIFRPDRAEIVRAIFESSISGLGGYTIAKQLNAKKVPAFGPSPKWDQSTIHNMLRNRATIGEHQPKRIRNGKRVPDGDPIPGFYPAAIDDSLFHAAQVARQNNLASGRGRKGTLLTNLFRGIPTCAYCASPVLFKSKSNIKSLICSRVIEKRGCFRFAWSYQDFERSFLDFVTNSQSALTTAPTPGEALAELVSHIRSLSGLDVYDARVGIAKSLKAIVSDLKIAPAGPAPVAGKPDARIRLDRAGRYFEVRFQNGPPSTGYPIAK
jgi:Recombinase